MLVDDIWVESLHFERAYADILEGTYQTARHIIAEKWDHWAEQPGRHFLSDDQWRPLWICTAELKDRERRITIAIWLDLQPETTVQSALGPALKKVDWTKALDVE